MKPRKLPVGVRPANPQEIARWQERSEGEKNPTADVLITESPSPTGADKVLKSLIRNSAHLKQHAESRKRAIEKHVNETNRQSAQRRKSIALEIAARLTQQERFLRLPRKTSELIRRIQTEWPRKETPTPGLRTIRRWLTEK